jgi:methyltransferase
VTLAQVILAAVLVQRGIELLIARRNTERLIGQGGIEHGAEHYPYLVVLHALWLTALVLSVPRETAASLPWLAVYLALTVLRVWTMASLGRFWTTRIISLPGAPLVARGPYRWLRHPNYIVVAGEIAVLPMVFGQWWIAIVFSLANFWLIRTRMRVEDEALDPRRFTGRES